MQGRSEPCGVGTEELRINGVPGLSSHDSSFEATYGNFELPGFPLAASEWGRFSRCGQIPRSWHFASVGRCGRAEGEQLLAEQLG